MLAVGRRIMILGLVVSIHCTLGSSIWGNQRTDGALFSTFTKSLKPKNPGLFVSNFQSPRSAAASNGMHVRIVHSSMPHLKDCWISSIELYLFGTCAWCTHSLPENWIIEEEAWHLCNTCMITDFIITQTRVYNFLRRIANKFVARMRFQHKNEATPKLERLVRIKNGFGFVKFFQIIIIIIFGEHPTLQWIRIFNIHIFAANVARFRFVSPRIMDFNRRKIHILALFGILFVEDKSWKMNPRWV